MGEPLQVDLRANIAVVTLDRPDALNAADASLHGALTTVWARLAAHEELRAVVLTGAGKAFSAGGDLHLLSEMAADHDVRTRIMREAAAIVRAMIDFDRPVVAAVNGPAVGLGCSLASLCDLVVIEEHAYLADPHVQLGLVSGDGGILTWPLNMGLQSCKEWLLLGGRISADRAAQLGLANRVVPTGQSLTAALELAGRLAALPPQAVRETLRTLNRPLAQRVEAQLDAVLTAETESFDTTEFQDHLAALLDRPVGTVSDR
jgi:enoyl-CoA hydratase